MADRSAEKSELPEPPTHPTRLVYLGTPQIAVPPLRALVEADFEVSLVITGPDRRRGRRGRARPSPVAAVAAQLGIPISHDPADAADAGADLGVVVAYGQLIRRPVLEKLPMINLHFSLLPRWRGAAPVERAILAGDETTGVCVMAVEEGLDTGPVYAAEEVPLSEDSTAANLSEHLADLGAELLVESLRSGLRDPEPQRGSSTYAEKLFADDRRIDWNSTAIEIDRQVRVGGAWTLFDGRRFKIHEAEPIPGEPYGPPGALIGDVVVTGDGGLRLIAVQAEGRPATTFTDWTRGARMPDDPVFGGSR